MAIEKKIVKRSLHDNKHDLDFWKTQTPTQRLAALEEIRREYHQLKYHP
jgi:hypothetical protein